MKFDYHQVGEGVWLWGKYAIITYYSYVQNQPQMGTKREVKRGKKDTNELSIIAMYEEAAKLDHLLSSFADI